MAAEARYQKEIMNKLEKYGGVAVNGTFSKAGEADLQCGIYWEGKLLHLAVEVKTPTAYKKLMSGITTNEGLYEITNSSKLDKREFLQLEKINRNRELEGKALFAHSFKQVLDYMNGEEL